MRSRIGRQHIEAGYTFNAPFSPQVSILYDYASGDDDPADGKNHRFDTLFGSRGFDFGPTSLYGPFTRENLSTPGIRISFSPWERIASRVTLRGFWLADKDDIWTVAGIGNVPGRSATHIGTQIDSRLRFELVPGNIRLEAGAAYLFAGSLMDNVSKDDSVYLYSQVVLWF